MAVLGCSSAIYEMLAKSSPLPAQPQVLHLLKPSVIVEFNAEKKKGSLTLF